MDEFFEYLKIIGIGAPSDAPRVLLNHTSQEVFEIATRCYSLTERPSPVPGEGAFNFTVNSTISGGIYPCSDHNCRRYNAYNLASFAALYVDSIYIPNFFEYVYQFNKRGGSFSNESQAANFVSRVITDIILMLELNPLFLANILHIHPQSGEYCSTHLKEIRQHETNLYNQFAKIEKDIVSDLVKKVKFQIYTNTIVPLDPSDYLGGGMYTFVSVPKRLRRYIGDVPYTFTDTEATELGIIGQYINPIFDDLTAQKYSAPLRNLPYLTNKKIELDIINQEPRRKRTGYDVMQGLSARA